MPSLQMNALGRADALARLGGPFVRVIEYVSPNDCVRQLGTVIVANPVIEENSKLAVVIKWTLFRNGKAQHTISEVDPNSSSDGGYIVQCPFSVGPNDPAQMMQWTAEIKVQWENETLIYAHQSKTLFPAIADWRVVIYDQEKNQNFGIDQILSDVKQINPNLEWQNYRQEVETTVSLDGPYTLPVYKKHLEQLNAGEKLACYAVTVINSPDEREVMLEFRAAGPLRFWMNGQPVEQLTITTGGRPVKSMIFNQLQVPRRTAAFQLKAGTNILLVASEPPERHHWWYFSVAVVRPDGSLMNDLSYSNYVEEAENVETELNSNPAWNPPTQSVPSQTDEQIPEEKS